MSIHKVQFYLNNLTLILKHRRKFSQERTILWNLRKSKWDQRM